MYLFSKIKFTLNFNKKKLRLNNHVVQSFRMFYTGNIVLFKITIEFLCYKDNWIMQTSYSLLREYIKFFTKKRTTYVQVIFI